MLMPNDFGGWPVEQGNQGLLTISSTSEQLPTA
jgi:hypothetical protein